MYVESYDMYRYQKRLVQDATNLNEIDFVIDEISKMISQIYSFLTNKANF